MSRLRIYFLLIAFIPSICLAQQIFFDSPLSLLCFVEEHPEDSVYLNGVDVQCRSIEWMVEHMARAQEYLNDDNKFVISKTVFLDKVNFIEGSDLFFRIQNCVFEKSIRVKIAEGSLPIAIVNSEFYGSVELTDFNYQAAIICEKNRFHNPFSVNTNTYNFYIDECEFFSDTSKSTINTSNFAFEENTQTIFIQRCQFSGQSLKVGSLNDNTDLVIKQSEFNHDLDLSNNKLGELSIRDSELTGRLSMNRTEFDDFRSYIPVDFFYEKLFINDLVVDGHFFSLNDFSETNIDFDQKYYVEQFLSVYRKFEDFYETKGNIEEKNIVTIRFHELNLQRKAHALKSDFSVIGAIGYLISSLIGYTTEFGTNPIRIINFSLITISLFCFIFLFDHLKRDHLKTSRDSLDFRKFIELLLLSILNSLNSFTTLGFGELPRRKSTAYIAVIEGFIGWLALTLFSVCLVTQFLA